MVVVAVAAAAAAQLTAAVTVRCYLISLHILESIDTMNISISFIGALTINMMYATDGTLNIKMIPQYGGVPVNL